MANPDRPNGFKFVTTLSGSPTVGMMRSVGVTDGADMFRGDLISLDTNLGKVAVTNDADFLGVAMGFGKVGDMSGEFSGAFNPDNLTTLYYDDSASTHTEWRVWYVPVDDAIFEVQTDTDLDFAVGDPVDLLATTAGSTVTGTSGHQIGANTNTDMRIVEIPTYPDNDSTLANTRYFVHITPAEAIFS